jgi:probable H4MPT-linked C1 transfer pathway protein
LAARQRSDGKANQGIPLTSQSQMDNDMKNAVIGWDIGGAHVKAAALDEEGRVLEVLQVPCPLWQGHEYLDRAIRRILQSLGDARRHAVTMTGEMVDLFESRDEGVMEILGILEDHCPADRVAVFAGTKGFVPFHDARDHVHLIASANWQATATSIARVVPEGLLLDIGSTTTDVIPLKGGKAVMSGISDGERLYTDELVYTGVVRTPLMALACRALFRGFSVGVVAEYFANTADVYRITGQLPDGADQQETPDGGPKTVEASCRRLARMIGMDSADATPADWLDLARFFADAQRERIFEACRRVSKEAGLAEGAPVVGAGVGRFLAPSIAADIGRSSLDFALCVGCAEEAWVAECAPAVSVAKLLCAVE